MPVAKIVGLKTKSTKKRVIGLAKGDFVVPDDFSDPLPDDLVAASEGARIVRYLYVSLANFR